jgi:hypothetical protein
MPSPKPESEVSLQDSKKDAADQMKDAEITEPQLKKANDPRFSAVLTAKDTLVKQADSAPAKYRTGEKGVLGQAANVATGASRRTAIGMVVVKGARNSAVLTKQQQAKARDEAKRLAVTTQIEAIYNDTKKAVEDRLNTLDTVVGDIFDKGVDTAIQSMKDFVDDKIHKWKLERYLLKPLGSLLWAKDLLLGLPDDVNVFYEQGRTLFTQLMNVLVTRVADLVERTLRETKQMVAQGRAKIQTLIDAQPKELQAQLKEAQQKVAGDFDSLEQSIDDKKNQLAQDLANKYKEAFDRANQELDKMQQENRGLLAKVVDAIGEVVKILLEFKSKLMALLKKGEDAIKLIIADPIGFLGNLIAAIKLGLSQFVNNIWTHLKNGFMAWLFGALTETGIQIPSGLPSLPAILQLVLAVLGITYDRMRAKAVKLIGERAVSVIETLVKYIKALIEGGPAKLWEEIKSDLSDLKDMVIGAIQDYIITTVVQRAIAKLVTLFNPVGAIVQAVLAIYDVVTFLIEKANQIMALVEAVINSVTAIATGAIGGAANWIEQALARFIPVVIGFLAQFVGLGKISKKIQEFIHKIQSKVDKAIDKVIAKVVGVVKKLIGKLTGKTRDEKGEKKPGAPHEEVGEAIAFSAAGESHRLWIDNTNGEVMLASSAAAVKSFLSSQKVQDAAKSDSALAGKVSQAVALAGKTRVDAQKVLHAQSQQQEASVTGANVEVKTKEQQLAALIIDIVKAVHGEGSIFQVLGKPVDSLQKAPDGYSLKTISGFKEIERGGGRGGSGRGSYPEVHCDQPGNIQSGVGRRRADYALIDRYTAAIQSVPKTEGDEQPNLLGHPMSLISDLDQRVNARRHSMAEGIRAQMERIIEVINSGTVLTGVEVPVGGKRSVDYSLQEGGQHVLVEYKHWTGKLSSKRRRELSTRLRTQLSEYVRRGQSAGFDKVVVEFKNFGSLDATTQSAFRAAMNAAAAVARGLRSKNKPIEFEARL